MQRSWNPYILLVGLKMMQPLWKTVRQFCKMLNLELPRDAAIPLLGINTQKMENLCPHKNLYVNVHSSQKLLTIQCVTTDEQLNKIQYILTMEYYSATRRNKVLIQAKL